jgi:hypothetical protein
MVPDHFHMPTACYMVSETVNRASIFFTESHGLTAWLWLFKTAGRAKAVILAWLGLAREPGLKPGQAQHYSDPSEEAGVEIEAMTNCLALVAEAELAAVGVIVAQLLASGELIAVAGGGAAFSAGAAGTLTGSTLPIVIPATLLGAIVGDTALCMLLVHLIFSQVFENAATPVCNALMGSSSPAVLPTLPIPTSPTTTPPNMSTMTTPTSVPALPSLAADACISCQLSVYILGFEGLALQCSVSPLLGTRGTCPPYFATPPLYRVILPYVQAFAPILARRTASRR